MTYNYTHSQKDIFCMRYINIKKIACIRRNILWIKFMAHSAIWGQLVKWKWKAKQIFWAVQKFFKTDDRKHSKFGSPVVNCVWWKVLCFLAFCNFDCVTSSVEN